MFEKNKQQDTTMSLGGWATSGNKGLYFTGTFELG